MIPKVIHQFWAQGELPAKELDLATSWVVKNPQYDYILWDMDSLPYEFISTRSLRILMNKQYSLVVLSDVVRYELLRIYGGIYADTDVECLQSFDRFLPHEFFGGFERDDKKGRTVGTAVFGCTQGSAIAQHCSDIICSRIEHNPVSLVNTQSHRISGPHALTSTLIDYSNVVANVVIYPREFFYPFGPWEMHRSVEVFENSYAKHYWHGMLPDGWTNRVTTLQEVTAL